MNPRILRRGVAFSTPWFDVVAKTVAGLSSDGQTDEYYALQTDDYVTVLATTADGRVPLVRQYRPAVEQYTLELPSGHVAPGESPAAAARRELREETGFLAARVELLGVLRPDTGRLENRLWAFRATDLTAGQPNERGIEVVLYERGELIRAVIASEVSHALDLAVLMAAVARDGWGSGRDA